MIIKSRQKFLRLTRKSQFYKRKTFLSLCERTDKLTCFLIFAWKPISYTCAKKLKSFIFDNFYISKTSLSLYWRSIYVFYFYFYLYIFFYTQLVFVFHPQIDFYIFHSHIVFFFTSFSERLLYFPQSGTGMIPPHYQKIRLSPLFPCPSPLFWLKNADFLIFMQFLDILSKLSFHTSQLYLRNPA